MSTTSQIQAPSLELLPQAMIDEWIPVEAGRPREQCTPFEVQAVSVKIANALQRVVAEKRAELLRAALFITSPQLAQQATEVCASFANDERVLTEKITSCIASAGAGLCPMTRSRMEFVGSALELSYKRGEDVIVKAAQFITPEMGTEDEMVLLQAVAQVALYRRKVVAACALSLITQKMDAFSRARIIKGAAALSPDESLTGAAIEQTRRFLTEEMDVESRLGLFRRVVSLLHFVDEEPIVEAAIFDQAALLIAQFPQMDGGSRNAVLFAVSEVARDNKTISPEVIDTALPFFSKGMDYLARAGIILNINKAPIPGRKELFTEVRAHLVEPEMAPESIAAIVHTACCAAAEVQPFTADLFSNAKRFFPTLLDPVTQTRVRGSIILQVQKIPAEERTDVVDQALRFITPSMGTSLQQFGTDMYSNEYCLILALVASVPRQRRAEVADYASRFITRETDGGTKGSVIKKLDAILAKQGGKGIVEKALQHIPPETTAALRLHILEAEL